MSDFTKNLDSKLVSFFEKFLHENRKPISVEYKIVRSKFFSTIPSTELSIRYTDESIEEKKFMSPQGFSDGIFYLCVFYSVKQDVMKPRLSYAVL